ncbi:MAG TPA: protoheme IX farnesyltransferase, partial [Planctomycetaceae bacterium]|nr:protoheme IX farnesyltransferase [Planctomycetaceae bacterium]
MSSRSVETCVVTADSVLSHRRTIAASGRDYLQLTKPRILGMALLAVTAGYALGRGREFQVTQLWHALLGIGLVAAAAGALNQYLERRTD